MAAAKGKGLDSLLIQDSLVELSLSGTRQRTWVAAEQEDSFVEQTCLGGKEVSLVEQDLFDPSVEQQTSVAASEDSMAEHHSPNSFVEEIPELCDRENLWGRDATFGYLCGANQES